MSSTIFNSQFENCMRLLVALDKFETAGTATELADADFAATYARHFGLGSTDLHGSTAFVNAIYTQRRSKAHEAIQTLVAHGYAYADHAGDVPRFTISESGAHLVSHVSSSYAQHYQRYVAAALVALRNDTLHLIGVKEET